MFTESFCAKENYWNPSKNKEQSTCTWSSDYYNYKLHVIPWNKKTYKKCNSTAERTDNLTTESQGIITSSPESKIDISAVTIACFPPLDTTILFSGKLCLG